MKKNKRIYGHRKKQAQYFKDLIKQKTHITSTGQATAACTFPEQLNHKPKDSEHDSSLWKWPFLDREARLGTPACWGKRPVSLWGNSWNLANHRGFGRTMNLNISSDGSGPGFPKESSLDVFLKLPGLYHLFIFKVLVGVKKHQCSHELKNSNEKNFIWLGKKEQTQLFYMYGLLGLLHYTVHKWQR